MQYIIVIALIVGSAICFYAACAYRRPPVKDDGWSKCAEPYRPALRWRKDVPSVAMPSGESTETDQLVFARFAPKPKRHKFYIGGKFISVIIKPGFWIGPPGDA